MPPYLPAFLLAIGLLVMWQPRTKRWKRRMEAVCAGDEQRIKQRANAFYLLGCAFVLAALSMWYRFSYR